MGEAWVVLLWSTPPPGPLPKALERGSATAVASAVASDYVLFREKSESCINGLNLSIAIGKGLGGIGKHVRSLTASRGMCPIKMGKGDLTLKLR